MLYKYIFIYTYKSKHIYIMQHCRGTQNMLDETYLDICIYIFTLIYNMRVYNNI